MTVDECLNRFGQDYLVVHFDHLFVADELEDEAWILAGDRGSWLMDESRRICSFFDLDPGSKQTLSFYSGGEKAIMATVLNILALSVNLKENSDGLSHILLVNIFESLALENRLKLENIIFDLTDSQNIKVFVLGENASLIPLTDPPVCLVSDGF